MDLRSLAKAVPDRTKTASLGAKVPVTVTVIDVHGSTVLQHRMHGAPAFSMLISRRKTYTSALIGNGAGGPVNCHIINWLASV